MLAFVLLLLSSFSEQIQEFSQVGEPEHLAYANPTNIPGMLSFLLMASTMG